MQEGLEGNPVAGTMKYFSRILAVVAVPVMITFPKVYKVFIIVLERGIC